MPEPFRVLVGRGIGGLRQIARSISVGARTSSQQEALVRLINIEAKVDALIRDNEPGQSPVLAASVSDAVTRLINIEAKVDGVIRDIHRDDILASAASMRDAVMRLINVEAKVDGVIRDIHRGALLPATAATDPFAGFSGSSDQAYGHLTYAQHGEDLIISNIFNLLHIDRPSYLDVGANHPLAGSNTALLYSRGSRGLVVEPNPALMPLWQAFRPGDVTLNCAVGAERGTLTLYRIDDTSGRNTTCQEVAEKFIAEHPQFQLKDRVTVDAYTLNDIVEQHAGGRWPDFLSLDVEGLDHAVLKAADFSRGKPKVICLEWRAGDGSDDAPKFQPLLAKNGFVPIFKTWGNLIAVERAVHRDLGLERLVAGAPA